jgi:hypothetical protein
MRLFKSKAFGRFARSQDIADDDLCEAIERAEKGLVDANLGGFVIKQRIARDGEGKSGGFRSVIFLRAETKRYSCMDLKRAPKQTSRRMN